MEKCRNALVELKAINQSYDISNKNIDALLVSTKEAKVCTPIIGKFSSGKSALVNLILGMSKKLLKEAITPETAVPCEIIYTESEEKATVFYNNEETKQISFEEFRNLEVDANTVKKTVVEINNSVLSEFPDVMIVDMPGFESGFEIHNKAIDDYVAKSLAYIIAIPADNMILTTSLGNILKELCIHDMPLCVAITKMDKRNDEYEESLQLLQHNLRKYIGDKDIFFCETSSYEGESGEIEDYLCGIQNRSSEILKSKLLVQIQSSASETIHYLTALSKNMDISESEFDEKIETQQKKIKKLESEVAYEKELFDADVEDCLCKIKNDIQNAFDDEIDRFTIMIMNKQNITENVNTIARSTVAKSKKTHFDPIIERYTRKISFCVSEGMKDIMSFEDENSSSNSKEYSEAYGKGENVIKGLAEAGLVSGIAALITPIALPIAVLSPIAGLVAYICKKAGDKKKREEAKRTTREYVISDVIPKAVEQVYNQVSISVKKSVIEINKAINDDLEEKRDLMEKSIRDIKADIEKENKEKETQKIQIQCDIERIEALINEL